jgi:hypothetical protein
VMPGAALFGITIAQTTGPRPLEGAI